MTMTEQRPAAEDSGERERDVDAWVEQIAAPDQARRASSGATARSPSATACCTSSSRPAPSSGSTRSTAPTASWRAAPPTTSRASRTAPSSARATRRTPAPPTTGATRPRCARPSTRLFDGSMRGRTMYVVPFSMGPIGSPLARLGVQVTDSPYVVVSTGIMTRMGDEALARIRRGAEWVPAVHSVGAPLADGEDGRPWPCNADEVHHPLPRDPRDLVVRLRLRRQRDPRQEGVRAADRLGHGARGGLARRAHAAAQGDQPARPGLPRRRRLPERVRQDQLRDAAADDPRLEGRDDRRRHRLARSRAGRPAARDQPRGRLLRRRPRHRAATATRPRSRPCGATRSSPTSRCATTATSGGRA